MVVTALVVAALVVTGKRDTKIIDRRGLNNIFKELLIYNEYNTYDIYNAIKVFCRLVGTQTQVSINRRSLASQTTIDYRSSVVRL